MSAIWHRVVNRRRDELIDELRSSTPPPREALLGSRTAQRLKHYLDRGDKPVDVLQEKRTLLGRASRLADPRGLERVTEWLRAPVEARTPRNQSAVESMLRTSQMHTLAAQVLCITVAKEGPVKNYERRCAEQALTPARMLIDTIEWCKYLSHEQAVAMHAFFASPEGKRWTRALRAALNTAADLSVESAVPLPHAKRGVLARLLAPFVTSARLTAEVVERAEEYLEPWDAEAADLFFWTPAEHPGHLWMRRFSETLREMREEFGIVRRHHSSGSIRST